MMFCIGATKAGTSWLHEHLAQHPECYFRSVKELHYFDALESGKLERERADVEDKIKVLLKRMLSEDGPRRAAMAQRLEDRTDWEKVLGLGREDIGAYLDYLCSGRQGRRLVGDVTPAYGLLPEDRLAQMAQLLPDVRFVYLMRDPVDRLWSHVRMNTARRSKEREVDPVKAHAMLAEVLKGGHRDIALRSDYAAVLTKLERVVPERQRLAMFYEDLFEPGGVALLCDFLGIAPIEADTRQRVHGGLPADLDPEAAQAARVWLAAQYDAVATRYGSLPEAWRAGAAASTAGTEKRFTSGASIPARPMA